jgi:hypothetical protein
LAIGWQPAIVDEDSGEVLVDALAPVEYEDLDLDARIATVPDSNGMSAEAPVVWCGTCGIRWWIGPCDTDPPIHGISRDSRIAIRVALERYLEWLGERTEVDPARPVISKLAADMQRALEEVIRASERYERERASAMSANVGIPVIAGGGGGTR